MESCMPETAPHMATQIGEGNTNQPQPNGAGNVGRRTYRLLLLLVMLLVCGRLGYSLAEFLLPLASEVPGRFWLRVIAGYGAYLLLRHGTESFLAELHKLQGQLHRQGTDRFMRAIVILLGRHGLNLCALAACMGILLMS